MFRSPGPDDIYPRKLKDCKEAVNNPLVSVLMKSLDSGEVPVMWRKTNVVPLFKKGDKTSYLILSSNYRPVNKSQ